MIPLAKVPFSDIEPGLVVIGATGKIGRVVGKTPEGQDGPQGNARFDSVEIEWEHRENHSYVFHHQADAIVVPNWIRRTSEVSTYASPVHIRQSASQASADLLAEFQVRIEMVMRHRSVGRPEMARRMGISESEVSDLLDQNSNPALSTVALAFHVLNDVPEITSCVINEILRSV